jgi:flagellar hook protein FlgE
MGYVADGTGTIQPGKAQAMQLPTAGITPAATSKMKLEFNLDSRAKVTLPAASPLLNVNDANTYNNATSLSVFDAKGQDVALTYYFQKSATDTWNVYATANGTTIGGTAAAPAPIASISFSADGSTPTITGVSGSTVAGTSLTFDVPASTNAAGAAALAITGVSMNLSGVTQFGSPYGVTNLAQDGFAAGQLSGVTIEKSGIVMATYSNGQSKPAGQLELATFRNEQGLTPLGGNLWARSASSGDPIVGTPSTGNLGDLQPGALEESNVDLTNELVNMITAQRVYQANAQTIKTEDQIMQTLVNLR